MSLWNISYKFLKIKWIFAIFIGTGVGDTYVVMSCIALLNTYTVNRLSRFVLVI